MKLKNKISQEKKWIFNDDSLSLPIQLKVTTSWEVQSQEHFHKTMFEYFYLLEGHMKILIDNIVYALEKDDLIVVEPGESHHIIEKSPDLLLLLLMPPPVPNDKVVLG
jgi:quercetin dioxygenase-like cupin family protein